MKKIAYIILAHRDPTLLARTIDKLSDKQTNRIEFFIHIDKKSDITNFLFLENIRNVHLVKNRIDVKWGSISIVQATLAGLYEASHDPNINYFFIISGQDYPIKKPSEILALTEQNKSYLKYDSLPFSNWKGGGMHRFNRYHFVISRDRIIRRLDNVLNFFLPRRKLPLNQKPFGGDYWCGLNVESVTYIFEFIKSNPTYLDFYKYTYLADEIFFQTVLLNAPQNITQNIVNQKISYADWSKPKGPPPAVLSIEDFDSIKNSQCLFVRKIDSVKSNGLLDLIDTNLLS